MFNRKLLAVSVAFACAIAVPTVRAETAAEEIARINESIAVLSAKKAELDLKSQIAAKQAEMNKLSGASMASSSAADQTVPVVRGIEGIDGKLTATLAFGGGVQQTVKQGEKIRGGWTITQIDVNSVTLTRGSDRTRLGFGTEPPALTSGAAGPGGQYPMPGR